MKKKKQIKKWLAVTLCFIMLMSHMMAYAEDMENVSTESTTAVETATAAESTTATASTTTAASTTKKQDTSTEKETKETRREAVNWTSNPLFSFYDISLNKSENGSTYELKLKFQFKNSEKEKTKLVEGDKAVLEIPKEWFVIEDSRKQQPVYYGQKAAKDGKLSKDSWADYTIKDHSVQLVFHKNAENMEDIGSVYGELELEGKIPDSVLKETKQEVVWTMQKYTDGTVNQTKLTLPAKKSTDSTKKKKAAVSSKEPIGVQIDGKEYDIIPSSTDLYGSALSQDIYWQDNNDINHRVTTNGYQELFYQSGKLEFHFDRGGGVDGTIQIPVSDVLENKNQLKVEDLGGTGHYVMRIDENVLPKTFTYVVEDEGGNPEEKTISVKGWDFVNLEGIDKTADHYGYFFRDIPDEETMQKYTKKEIGLGWYYLKEFNYTANIVVRHGNKGTIENIKEAIFQDFVFKYKETGISPDFESRLLEQGKDEILFEKTASSDKIDTYTLTVADVPQYRVDGSEREYHITQQEKEDPKKEDLLYIPKEEGKPDVMGDDYFRISYTNVSTSSHGTAVDRAYSGGTVTLTLAGETRYKGQKVWRDEKAEDRPALEFTLWRYSKTGDDSDYTMASQVRNLDGKLVKITVPAGYEQDTLDLNFRVGIEPEDDILLRVDRVLNKYDSDGNEYVYFAKESMAESEEDYMQTFGKVVSSDDGSALEYEDTLPYDGERKENDKCIYNGGTVNNSLSGTVEASLEKSWKAMAYQDEFKDVRVEFTLQAKHKEKHFIQGDEWYDVTDDSGKIITKEMTGFNEEKLTESYQRTMDKYDSFGHELEYRWVETGVYQGENAENLLKDGKFQLEQKGRTVHYTSDLEDVKQEDGSYKTVIVNRIADTVDFNITKRWMDDKGNELQEDNPNIKPVGLVLFRQTYDGKNVTLMRVKLDKDQISITERHVYDTEDDKIDAVMNGNWKAAFKNLPEYDKDGHSYEYFVLEEGGIKARYEQTQDPVTNHYNEIITNTIGTGIGTLVNVRKRWIDDGDVQHRGKVTVELYQRIGENNFKKIEQISDGKTTTSEIQLDAERFWWKQVEISGDIKHEDVLALEKTVAYSDGSGESAEIRYTPEQMETIWNEVHAKDHTKEETTESTVTKNFDSDEHKYKVNNFMKVREGTQFFTVVNERLGEINLEITNEWLDGDGEEREKLQQDLSAKGISAYLKLTCDNENVQIDAERGIITVNGIDFQIRDKNNKAINAYQKIDIASGELERIEFQDLPKYDEKGTVIHYSVEQVFVKKTADGQYKETTLEKEGISTEFIVSKEIGDYATGHLHTDDWQKIVIKNRLFGTKAVRFSKEWRDVYRVDRDERPDIYLDVYRKVHNSEKPDDVKIESVELDYLWENASDETNMFWEVEFSELPKYDDYGYEITYYAREKMHVDAKALDYKPVYYKYDDQVIGDETGYSSGHSDDGTLINTADRNSSKESDEKVWVLKEGGTFVNQLEQNIVIEGKKLWGNIPSGYEKADLPAVTFNIYQKYYEKSMNDITLQQVVGASLLKQPQTTQVQKDLVQSMRTAKMLREGNKITIASITMRDWSKQYSGDDNSYQFQVKYKGNNTNSIDADGNIQVSSDSEEKIPLYDENGRRYDYTVEEQLDRTDVDAEGLTDVYNEPEINNFYVSNFYESKKGKLTVKKILDVDLAEGEKYPAVQFTLHRYYTDSKGVTKRDTSFEREGSISYEAYKDEKASYTFVDLDIFAPNGKKWQYKVTEKSLDGYVSYAGAGDLEKDGITAKGSTVEGLNAAVDETVDASFKNAAHPKKIVISGVKIWQDNHDMLGLRPTVDELNTGKPISFKIKRSAPSQPGQDNAIEKHEVEKDKFTITWEAVDGKADQYKFKIQGNDPELERYAPNGMAWTYYLEEEYNGTASGVEVLPGYQKTREVQCTPASEEEQEALVYSANVTNTWKTDQINFTKLWKTADISNPTDTKAMQEDYLGYKIQLEFALQSRITAKFNADGTTGTIDKATDWTDMKAMYQTVMGQPEDKYQSAFDLAIEKSGGVLQFDADNNLIVKNNTPLSMLDADQWKKTFTYLPGYVRDTSQTDKSYYQIEYRLVERKIIFYDTEGKKLGEQKTDNSANALFQTSGTPADKEAAWENTLPVTQLTVKKIWDDGGNAYGTRPKNAEGKWETKFEIQRKDKNDASANWEKVTTVSLAGDNTQNTAEKTVENLPAYGLKFGGGNPVKIEYEYRAREINEDQSIIEGANTQHGYYGIYNVAYTDTAADTGVYATEITNAVKRTIRYAQKKWNYPEGYDKDTWNQPVTLELKYKTKDGNTASFAKKAKVTLNGSKDGKADPYGEYEAWKAVWKEIPEVMPNSETDASGQTVYVIEEISDGSFYQDGEGSGSGISENDAFVVENTTTKLEISKKVDLGDSKTLTSDDLKEQEFKFKLTNDKNVSGTYKAVVKDGTSSTTKEITMGSGFTLRDKETIVIYGLPRKKDGEAVQYKAEEIKSDEQKGMGFDTTVSVNGADKVSGSSGMVSLPGTKPADEDISSIAFTNALEGAIHLVKKDENENPLKGVEFTIEYSESENGTYSSINADVCSNQELVNKQGVLETNENGELSFTDLKLGYYYKITETKPLGGMNGLKESIITELPKAVEDITSIGNIQPVGTKDGKNIFVELKYEVINNTFTMPATKGPGFFWPGIAGLILAAAGGGYWMISNRKKKQQAQVSKG